VHFVGLHYIHASTSDLTHVVCRDAQKFVSRQHMHFLNNALNDTVHLGVCKTTQRSNQAAPMHRSPPLLLDSSSAVFLYGTQFVFPIEVFNKSS